MFGRPACTVGSNVAIYGCELFREIFFMSFVFKYCIMYFLLIFFLLRLTLILLCWDLSMFFSSPHLPSHLLLLLIVLKAVLYLCSFSGFYVLWSSDIFLLYLFDEPRCFRVEAHHLHTVLHVHNRETQRVGKGMLEKPYIYAFTSFRIQSVNTHQATQGTVSYTYINN